MNRPIISELIRKLKSPISDKAGYKEKYEMELDIFNKVENVHALPGIFHYWSHMHLRPQFLEMGVRGINEFFYDYMSAECKKDDSLQTFVSIGAGRCEIEMQVVEMLVALGHKNFILECMDINTNMLQRGHDCAAQKGLDQYMRFVTGDALGWNPKKELYSVVMAHQSLHHVLDLEVLFEKVNKSIGGKGVFLTSDIIGRNGHMRWPEAMQEINKIWAKMPLRYKYNHALKRFEETYENWDCSTEGFEGIRAQDILLLLRNNFSFEIFLGFGNLIDIFVDRAFGHNFDPKLEEDQKFIDKVAKLDDQLIKSGALKPTHIIAAMRASSVAFPKYYKHLTPEFCTRKQGS